MYRQALLGLLLLSTVVGGCHCQKDRTTGNPDGSTLNDGGDGGSDGGDGGGDGLDGSVGCGDFCPPPIPPATGKPGPASGGVSPGGFSLDGGTGMGGTGVAVDPTGNVVLNSAAVKSAAFMWIANASQGWVSKYDTNTGREIARYYAVIPVDGLGGAHPELVGNQGVNIFGSSPSRTTLDLNGDVWVANRAPNLQGSVTKIATDPANCIDRNGDKKLNTSVDLNGNGQIDPNEMIVPTDWNDPKTYDECVLFSTPIGATASDVQARGMAIAQGAPGSAGDIWVAHYRDSRMYKLDSSTGQSVSVDPTNPNGSKFIQLSFGPYGAAVDKKQRLWVVSAGLNANLALIDTKTGTLLSSQLCPPQGCGAWGSYGIGIDGKNRVWLGGHPSAGFVNTVHPVAIRYDPDTDPNGGTATNGGTAGKWTFFDFNGVSSQLGTFMGRPRGIAADDQGFVWMAADTRSNSAGADPNSNQYASMLIGFNGDDGGVKLFQPSNGSASYGLADLTDSRTNNSIGVGIDENNQIWMNNYSGNVTRVDRNTGDVLRSAQQPGGLYSYSDFTGYQLRHFTAPQGKFHTDFNTCGPSYATTFNGLTWDATIPAGTSLTVLLRVAETAAGLSGRSVQTYTIASSGLNNLSGLNIPPAHFAQVEFILASPGSGTPSIHDFNLTWTCNSSIN